jgi:hypothetical protein
MVDSNAHVALATPIHIHKHIVYISVIHCGVAYIVSIA